MKYSIYCSDSLKDFPVQKTTFFSIQQLMIVYSLVRLDYFIPKLEDRFFWSFLPKGRPSNHLIKDSSPWRDREAFGTSCNCVVRIAFFNAKSSPNLLCALQIASN